MSKKKVLVLCTGNSCRSQMAEGMINHYLGEAWVAYSAGTEPAGYVHPLAIAAVGELGIDISNNKSKSTDDYRGLTLGCVITVCDDAVENCPVWLGEKNTDHIGFLDPAKTVGTDAEMMIVFRQVRDDIRDQVLGYLSSV